MLRSLAALYRRADELGFTMIDAALSPEANFAKISSARLASDRASGGP